MISSTAFLNVVLSIYHKKLVVYAFMEAERGALNNNANYPNPPSAGDSFFLNYPSI